MIRISSLLFSLIFFACASKRDKSFEAHMVNMYTGLKNVEGVSKRACKTFFGINKLLVPPAALDSLDTLELVELQTCMLKNKVALDTCTMNCNGGKEGEVVRCGSWVLSKDSTKAPEISISNSDCSMFPTVETHHYSLRRVGEKLVLDSLQRITHFSY